MAPVLLLVDGVEVVVDERDPVAVVITNVSQKLGIRKDRFYMSHHQRPLSDVSRPIERYGLKHGSVLNLHFRLLGGGIEPMELESDNKEGMDSKEAKSLATSRSKNKTVVKKMVSSLRRRSNISAGLPENQASKYQDSSGVHTAPVMSFRKKLERYLATSMTGFVLDIINTSLSMFACAVFVWETYTSDLKWFDPVELVLVSYFTVDFALRLYSASHRLQYMFSLIAIIDLLTILPVFFTHAGIATSAQFLKFGRLLRVLRILRLHRLFQYARSDVNRQLAVIMLTVVSLIFIAAGLMQILENNDLEQYSFHDMVYFIVVTLSTVGYGDIAPQTSEGRMAICVIIVVAVVLIPTQTNELVRLMDLQSIYARRFHKPNPDVPSILLSGNITVTACREAFHELFHVDHGSQDKMVVILHESIPSADLEILLRNPLYDLSVKYLQGTPMSDKHLSRAGLIGAGAGIILSAKYSASPLLEDNKTILQALAIKQYTLHFRRDQLRLCMQLIRPESKAHYYQCLGMESNDQLVCVEEIKLNILAKSCTCPGVIAMLSNLIVSSGLTPADLPVQWLEEYCKGQQNEIYRAPLSPKFQGLAFAHVAHLVYKNLGAVLFAIEVEVAGKVIVRLNPGSYSIPDTVANGVHGFVICEDKSVADAISYFQLEENEIASLKALRKRQEREKEKLKSKTQSRKGPKGGGVDRNKVIPSSSGVIGSYMVLDGEEESEEEEAIPSDHRLSDHLDDSYFLLPDRIPFSSIVHDNLAGSLEVRNHILLCGLVPSIFYFLLPLRSKNLKALQNVVILHPEPPSDAIWKTIARFPFIYFVRGSSLNQDDLKRANISQCEKALILSAIGSGGGVGISEELLDAETIFQYKAIKKANRSVQIITEIVHNSNLEFLSTRTDWQFAKIGYEMTPLFAAGEVYLSSMLDTLTCQAFYNPHIVTIMNQFTSALSSTNPVIAAICASSGLKTSSLWQIPVPHDYANGIYKDMFHYLTNEKNLVAIGLYRGVSAQGNKLPFVYTNPSPDARLTPLDRVFVVGVSVPDDLIDEDGSSTAYSLKTTHLTPATLLSGYTSTATAAKANTGLHMMESMAQEIRLLKEQLVTLRTNLDHKDLEILDKVRAALRKELSALV